MTVATTTNRNDYVGNGSQTVFAYTFRIFAASDLQVFVNGVVKTLGSDYTVSGVGGGTGGNVTLTTAPGAGTKVAIVRAVPYTQETDYVANDPFPAETHEAALDKLTMLVQQVKEITDRSAKVPTSSSLTGLTVPEPIAGGELIRWKPDKSNLEVVAPSSLDVTMNPIVAQGDLIRGGAGAIPERIALGASGTGLVVSPATGKPEWAEGTGILALTNRTGGSLAVGDVVGLDTTNNDSVVLADTAGATAPLVVALTSVANLAAGLFAHVGRVSVVNVTGAVTRGNYLRKSATTKVAEDSGIAMGATTPNTGAFAVALGSAAGPGLGAVPAILLAEPSRSSVPAVTAKGDILVATGPDVLVRKGVEADGTFLRADSAQSDGLRWAPVSELPGANYFEFVGMSDPANPASGRGRLFSSSSPSGLYRLYWLPEVGARQAIPTVTRRTVGGPAASVSNSAAETSVFAFAPTIFGGMLGTDRMLRITVLGDFVNNTGVGDKKFTPRFKYGTTTFATLSSMSNFPVGTWGWRCEGFLSGSGLTALQRGWATFRADHTSNAVSAGATLTEDSTVDKTLDITVQNSVADVNVTTRVYVVQIELI